MSDRRRLSFGIKTSQMSTSYEDVLRVWTEADGIPEIEHAWLWDHFLPLFRDPKEPIHEAWTLLSALAAQTERLRLGLMVTSAAIRPPAVLAKMASTVDVISRGRLIFGIGVGGTQQPAGVDNPAVAEYAACGVPLRPPAEGIERLAEVCTIVRLMWSGERFDFSGRHFRLAGAVCRPRPVQRPGPPCLIGALGERTLRVVAEHADIWNVPGPPHGTVERAAELSGVLDELCRAAGRDPADITRSTQLIVSYDDPRETRAEIAALIEAGFSHFVLAPMMPFPAGVARWVADEFIRPMLGQTSAA